jgi:glutathione synthase/RimK-type ligase-like ATP-grasp enzyme
VSPTVPRTPTVAIVTCSRLPGLDDDDRPVLAALADRGVDASPEVWDDPQVDWGAFDLAVVRSPWDYTDRVEAFVKWAHDVPRLANPAAVLIWNVDKRYLADLAGAGVPIVPTTYVAPGESTPPLPEGEVVVKPTVSAGSRDTFRLDDPGEVVAHIAHIHSIGKTAMVQPYLQAVDERGETAVVFIDGDHSHAARKGPLLPLGRSLVDGLYAPEQMSPRVATADELDVARAALAVVPGPLLYGRVDLLTDDQGAPVVLEVEVTEPSLFLEIGGAVDRLADAIAATIVSR